MDKFKVGDRIKIVNCIVHSLDGTTGTIIKIDDVNNIYRTIVVQPDKDEDTAQENYCLLTSEIELIIPRENQMELFT